MAYRPQRWQWVGLLLLGAILAGVFIYDFSDRTRVNEANYDKIEPGMTLRQVEAILGGPANYMNEGPVRIWTRSRHVRTNADMDNSWASFLPGQPNNLLVIQVSFDFDANGAAGAVTHKSIDVNRIRLR